MVTARFIDRARELSQLVAAWESGRPQLILMSGRRRVGKSELLTRLVDGRRITYYIGARQLPKNQLDDLGAVLGRIAVGFRPGRPPSVALHDWDDALALLAEAASRQRVGLIIDEFPYLIDADPALPSLIQRWWDRIGSESNVMLLLAGSHQAMMRNLVAYDGALHGRPTLRMELEPLDYVQAAKFYPAWSSEDRIRAFAVTGGIPAYLQQWDDGRSVRDEMLRLAYQPGGHLVTEAPTLLAAEFTEPRTYESILRAIARGEAQPSRIAQYAGLSGANTVGPYLDRLISLGFVERQTLPSETGEIRPRTSRYVLADHYLRFYFALVDPHRSAIQIGEGEAVLDSLWGERFELFVSRTFEEVARRYVWLDRGLDLPPLSSVGPWWFPAGDIDIAAIAGSKLVAAGEARWSNSHLKPADLQGLRSDVARVAPGATPKMLLFSRGGFDRNVQATSDVRLIRPAGMFGRHVDLEYRHRKGST